MSGRLRIASDAAANISGLVSTVAASLPISLVRSDQGDPDAVAIDGSAGWVRRALTALESGIRGVVVVSPVFEPDIAALDRRAQSDGIPVILDFPWASNPAVAAARTSVAAIRDEVSFVDLVATVSGAEHFVPALNELRLLSFRLIGRSTGLHAIEENAGSLLVGARHAGSDAPVTFHVIHAPAPEFAVRARVVSIAGDVDVRIPDADTARPALVTSTGGDGAALTPTRYESSHRHSWRRLVELVSTRDTCDDIDEFTRAMTSA